MTPAHTALHPLTAWVHAAIYLRVSTERQKDEGYSLASQLEMCLAYAKQHGFLVAEPHIFIDDETGKTLDRPGLQELREVIARGMLQAVIVFKIDRWGRDLGHQLFLTNEWRKYGVNVFDTATPPAHPSPQRTLYQQMLGAIAEFEHAQILERTEGGRRARAKAGYPLPQMVALGYRYDGTTRQGTYVIVEAEAMIVRQMFRWYVDEQLSLYQIAKRLNEDQVPTHTVLRGRKPQRHAHLWQTSTVHVILTNETYIGTAYYGKTTGALRKKNPSDKKTSARPMPRETWIALVVPAIISQELFAAARQRLSTNARSRSRTQKYPYLVGGGRLRCGVCGYTMVGTGSARQRYYRCSRPSSGVKPTCQRNLNAVVADLKIWTDVCDFVRNPALVLDLWEQTLRGETPQALAASRDQLEGDRKRIEREITQWENAYAAAAISLDNFKGKRLKLESSLDLIDTQRALLQEAQKEGVAWAAERGTYEDRLRDMARMLPELRTVEQQQWLIDWLNLKVVYMRDKTYQYAAKRPERAVPLPESGTVSNAVWSDEYRTRDPELSLVWVA